jgi:hypothetical protein
MSSATRKAQQQLTKTRFSTLDQQVSRRLEDHIKDLCAKVIASRETELDPAISELKSALREHTIRMRKMVAENFAKGKHDNRRSP